jgi:hypothetical protein
MSAAVIVMFTPSQWTEDALDRLERIARRHPGGTALSVRFVDRPVLRPLWGCRVFDGPALRSELRAAFGPDAVQERGAA